MNQLVWDDDFNAALRKFVGSHRADWLYKDGEEITQVFDVLGGPPDPRNDVSPDLMRFSACRPHSCDEKGAVFLTPDGMIKAVAVLHFDIGNLEGYDLAYTLSIILPRKDASLIKAGKDWAHEILARDKERYPTQDQSKLEHVDILLRP